MRAEYTLSVAGFKGEVGAKVVDDSRGFMKAPFALYAGVRGFQRAPSSPWRAILGVLPWSALKEVLALRLNWQAPVCACFVVLGGLSAPREAFQSP